MMDWHKKHLDLLSAVIVNEFLFWYEKIKNKNDSIYAVALILDEDALTAYLAVSTWESLNDKHEGNKWEPSEWLYTVDDGDVFNDLNSFVKLMIKHYDEDVIPLYEKGFDYNEERQRNLWMYTEVLKEAKLIIIKKFGSIIDEIVFYLSILGDHSIEIESSKSINKKSEILTDLVNYRT
ncbi:DUF4303 domain-containing protein [Acinetobacter rudis]|uniref:DUF4303 domain-containing protein n=1 Tax=Acinetobacter rudis TaxID=632955 RepID=UPI00333F9299